jgi:hypothetical protein
MQTQPCRTLEEAGQMYVIAIKEQAIEGGTT